MDVIFYVLYMMNILLPQSILCSGNIQSFVSVYNPLPNTSSGNYFVKSDWVFSYTGFWGRLTIVDAFLLIVHEIVVQQRNKKNEWEKATKSDINGVARGRGERNVGCERASELR